VGVPRTICLNARQYLIKTQLYQIYCAFANTVSRDQFEQVCEKATGTDPHGFLYIDVVPKEPWMRFHQGFNPFLIPEGNLRKRKGDSDYLKKKQGHALDSKQESET